MSRLCSIPSMFLADECRHRDPRSSHAAATCGVLHTGRTNVAPQLPVLEASQDLPDDLSMTENDSYVTQSRLPAYTVALSGSFNDSLSEDGSGSRKKTKPQIPSSSSGSQKLRRKKRTTKATDIRSEGSTEARSVSACDAKAGNGRDSISKPQGTNGEDSYRSRSPKLRTPSSTSLHPSKPTTSPLSSVKKALSSPKPRVAQRKSYIPQRFVKRHKSDSRRRRNFISESLASILEDDGENNSPLGATNRKRMPLASQSCPSAIMRTSLYHDDDEDSSVIVPDDSSVKGEGWSGVGSRALTVGSFE